MKILRIYIPIYGARRVIRFRECLNRVNLVDKRKELIRFINIPLDERE